MSILALNNALSGLKTSQRALGVISDNIANAKTEGYVRKIAEPSSLVLDGQGVGVEIGRISRVVDEYLLREQREEVGELKAVETLEGYFSEVQDLFGQPGDNTSIAALMERLQTAMQKLENSPEDPSNAQKVVDAAENIATRLNDMYFTLQDLRSRADNEIGEDVDTINRLLNQIDEFNVDIITAEAKGQDAGGLRDKRDVALNKLSELIGITYFENSDGAVSITTTGGKTLLDVDPVTVYHDVPNGLRSDIAFDPDRVLNDPDLGTIRGILVGGLSRQNDITSELRRGEVKGLVDLRDTILPALVSELDELTRQLRDGVNAVHNLGSAFPPPNSLNGQRTFIDYVANGVERPSSLSAREVLFNGTGVLRVSILESDPPSQAGETVASFNVDLDYIRTLDTGASLNPGGGAPDKVGGENQLTVEDVRRAVQAQFDRLGGVGAAEFLNGRLSIQAADPDHGVLVDAARNIVGSTLDATAPQAPAGAVAGLMNGDRFQILGSDASQLGVVTIRDVDVDGVLSLQDIARAINDEVTGVPGVTARLQSYPEPINGIAYRLEITADDSQSISIEDVDGTPAQTIGLIDADSVSTVLNAVTNDAEPLSGQPTAQFLDSRGFADAEVALGKIDGVRTEATAGRLSISVGGATAFSDRFDLTATSLSDIVTQINLTTLQGSVEAAILGAGGAAADVATAQALVAAGYPGDLAALSAALGASGITGAAEAAAAVFAPSVQARLVNVDGWTIELSTGGGADLSVSGELATTLGFEAEDFGISHYFGLNDFFALGDDLSASSDLDVVAGVADDPNLLSRARGANSIIDRADVGVGGGEITTALTAGDNSGAKILALAMLRDVAFAAAGDLPETTVSLPRYAARILSNQALRAAANGDDLAFREDVVGELSARVQNISGVNIDEELSNLILFQNAFTASARVISASQELLDELVNVVR